MSPQQKQKPVICVLPLLIHNMFMYGEDEKKNYSEYNKSKDGG